MFNSLCLMVENLRICNLRFAICGLAHQQNLQFADQSKEICGLAYLRYLRIFLRIFEQI
jgi:hypothetical protein